MAKRENGFYGGGLLLWGALVIACFQSFKEQSWADGIQLLVPIFGIPLWWIVFFVRVYCGVRTDNTPYCRNSAYGLILGCKQEHKWSKPLARFNYFGIDWLHRQARVTLGEPPAGLALSGTESRFQAKITEAREPRSTRNELITLYLGVGSLVVAVIQTIIAIAALG